MKNQNITEEFGELYHPVSALVFFESKEELSEAKMYVEHYDMDADGNPVNAHPLTVLEAQNLARMLNTDEKENSAFLQPKGILSTNVLHFNPDKKNGSMLWYTKAQKRTLFFKDNLGIKNGKAFVPALLWQATKETLSIYALDSNKRPNHTTTLYHAPFFNIYQDGKTCMGTVNIQIKNSATAEEFTAAWENYFFNSYFSHLNGNYNPVKGNCVTLWKELILTGKPFPLDQLKKNNKKVKNLLP